MNDIFRRGVVLIAEPPVAVLIEEVDARRVIHQITGGAAGNFLLFMKDMVVVVNRIEFI